jgi:hypothetical protein
VVEKMAMILAGVLEREPYGAIRKARQLRRRRGGIAHDDATALRDRQGGELGIRDLVTKAFEARPDVGRRARPFLDPR